MTIKFFFLFLLSILVTGGKIRSIFTVDNITFICFRYALNALLKIK